MTYWPRGFTYPEESTLFIVEYLEYSRQQLRLLVQRFGEFGFSAFLIASLGTLMVAAGLNPPLHRFTMSPGPRLNLVACS